MIPGLVIRRYQPHDLEEVWTLHNTALEDAGFNAGNGPWDDDLRHVEASYLQPGGEFLVGTLDKLIVAMGAFKPIDGAKAELKRMRVHPRFQRKGFGQAILEALESLAAKAGYTSLHLDTPEGHLAAQRFYLKNGYVQTGATKIGQFDALLYEKKLS